MVVSFKKKQTDTVLVFSSVINSQSTKIIDSIALNNFFSIQYEVTIYNEIQNLNRTFNLTVFRQGSSVNDTLYARTGNGDLSVVVTVNGSNAELQITNNELFNVNVKYSRLIL